MLASDTVEKAADLLRERGWTQHTFEDSQGRLCVVGALHHASSGAYNALASETYNAIAKCLGRGDLPLWNDAPERTQAEVEDKLMEAAKALRNEGL